MRMKTKRNSIADRVAVSALIGIIIVSIGILVSRGKSDIDGKTIEPDKPPPVTETAPAMIVTPLAHDDGAAGAKTTAATTLPEVEPEPEPDKPYTESDIILLCKMVYGEARGCKAEEQALCVWTVLNRLDSGRFGDSIEYIVTAPRQFVGYKAKHPVTDEIRAVVEEALEAWANGEEAPTCPPYAKTSGYLYFSGRSGHNWFK